MKILAIETTGPYASAALIDETGEIREMHSDKMLSHLQCLVPMIGNLLESCQLTIDDLTHIAVSEGPGSFTGIRIGMATAKALAQVKNLPVIPVPTLMAFAFNVPDFGGLYCPIFDARREQVYGGAYYFQDGRLRQAFPDGAYGIEEYFSKVEAFDPKGERQILLFGDGADRYGSAVEDWKTKSDRKSSKGDFCGLPPKDEDRYQKAASVARLAAELLREGKQRSFLETSPVYLRKPEAERKLEEKRAREEQQ